MKHHQQTIYNNMMIKGIFILRHLSPRLKKAHLNVGESPTISANFPIWRPSSLKVKYYRYSNCTKGKTVDFQMKLTNTSIDMLEVSKYALEQKIQRSLLQSFWRLRTSANCFLKDKSVVGIIVDYSRDYTVVNGL